MPTLFFSFFSKVDPSSNVIVAESLCASVNKENVRRMKVNAQVTAVTSVIEVLGNILQWVIWIFVTKFAGYGTLIQSILLYFIILPYVFLMNTRENKNRIVDEGWMTVVKNALGPIGHRHSVLSSTEIQTKHQNNVESCSRGWNNFLLLFRNIKRPCSSDIKMVKPDSKSHRKSKSDIEVFTIYNNENVHGSDNINNTIPSINVPLGLEPCSSRSKHDNFVSNITPKQQKSVNKRTVFEVRYDMICVLLSSTIYENHYIDNFKRLISFEEAVKKDDEGLNCFLKMTEQDDYCTQNLSLIHI